MSITDLDWDKFDHLYEIDPNIHHQADIPSTPPPNLSKETRLAISALDSKQQKQHPQALTYSQYRYKKDKERKQEKLEKMTKEEREKYSQQEKIKKGEQLRKRKDRMGYKSYTAKKYGTLKELIDKKSS